MLCQVLVADGQSKEEGQKHDFIAINFAIECSTYSLAKQSRAVHHVNTFIFLINLN